MFTGIIEEVGIVKSIGKSNQGLELEVVTSKVIENTLIGDSIAVNGVCLTVTNITKGIICFDVMNETVKKTNLIDLKTGAMVNLERATAVTTRFGGHIVSGHIDFKSKIESVKDDGFAKIISLPIPIDSRKYFVDKGSVCLNGVSLTIASIKKSSLQVSIIPHTKVNTNLLTCKNGSVVNVEVDIIGKYVENLAANKQVSTKDNITLAFLKENGFR